MIAVNINAGLANQMFHYAFGRGLMAKGVDVYFDQSNFKPRSQWNFEYIKLQDAFPNIEIKQMPKGHFRLVFLNEEENTKIEKNPFYYLWPRILRKLGIEKYFIEPTYGYIEHFEDKIQKNCIYRGFWQSEKYFLHCKDDIKKQFTFLPFDEPENIELAKKMANENSVSIHFRKGKDYAHSMDGKPCDKEYYLKAINYIQDKVKNPVFYVFTDNPQWVKTNIPPFDYILVNWNSTSSNKSFRDMQLMTHAKHNIIGNSTYSWWGAWLNPNPDKIVIGPKRFWINNDPFFSQQDIMCDSWIKL